MTGRIFSINISKTKGVPKDMVVSAVLQEGIGFRGDAHAGPGIKQVSLLSIEDIEKLEESGVNLDVDLRPGIFAENITIEGIDLSKVTVGDQFIIRDSAILTVTQIGKTCHERCGIGQKVGQCLMPKRGIFARVEKGSEIKVRDPIRLVKRKSFPWPKI